MAIVEASLVDAALAKINLTLRVLGRRQSGKKAGYHEIESLVAFANVGDMVRLQTGVPLALEVDGPYAKYCGLPADNLVLKAAAALAAQVPGLRLGRFSLTKELPVASGIGGGSADAAAALRLLVHGNRQIFAKVDFTDPRVQAAAFSVGADVTVCLESKARIMRGVGEILLPPLVLPKLAAVLVNPGAALATRDVFAKFGDSFDARADDTEVPQEPGALIEWLGRQDNDLTPAAIACAPVIADVLDALRAASGALLARMSGSGATCFALFGAAGEAAAAAAALHSRHDDWWVMPAMIG
jgi:4-diphosphocytidyl-2-C-methyl-D-erythritol kinase